MRTFLNAKSDFSIGESLLKPEDIVSQAKLMGHTGVVLVDTMTVSGMVEFFKNAKKKGDGIKPILGCRLKIFWDAHGKVRKAKDNPFFEPKVYVINEQGFNDLMGLLTQANNEPNYYYQPRIALSELLDAISKGNLIVSTGDFNSMMHMVDRSRFHYEEVLAEIKATGAQVYCEIVPVNTVLFDRLNHNALEASKLLQLPLLLTYPTLYDTSQNAEALNISLAISKRWTINDKLRWVQSVNTFEPYDVRTLEGFIEKSVSQISEQYGKDAADVAASFQEALENQQRLIDLVDYEWTPRDISLPQIVPDEFEELKRLCAQGWVNRINCEVMGYKPDASLLPEYKNRLRYELSILKKMGFERYFLLVHDLVSWSKSNDILVGPGRGSVGGSLVAFLLGITDVDPLRFDLLFERFINPDRIDLPDADLDFMSSKRSKVIAYLKDKYGEDYVAGISNYTSMASSGALRDVSRTYGLSQVEMKASKLVPKEHGKPKSLEDAADEVPQLAKFRDKYKEIWDHSVTLSNKLRSLGSHAAGIVVAAEPLRNRAVIERRNGVQVVNWDKRSVEDFGLVKIDILGLSTLDVIHEVIKMIEKNHGKKINLLEIPLDDPKVINNFGGGHTKGVFQFESHGMRKLLKTIADGADLSFEDLVAVVALYRPGPLDSGMTQDYVAIKIGAKMPFYDHPNMENALSPTNGVIVYQEQVMQLSRDLAGFTMTEADHLRKAMGKKDPEAMAEQEDKWVEGCKSHSGMSEEDAKELFKKIAAFAGYGFNRSHSVEYVIISYWMMWFKTYYTKEFYAGSLTVVDKEEKITELVDDAHDYGINICPPLINYSTDKFTYIDHGGETFLVPPFQSVKGLSKATARYIVKTRVQKGEFTSVEDMKAKIDDARKCNAGQIGKLESIGSFSSDLKTTDPELIKRRQDLMPGLVVQHVMATRMLDTSKTAATELAKIAISVENCSDCPMSSFAHATAHSDINTKKLMVIVEKPSMRESESGHFGSPLPNPSLLNALKEADLYANDMYLTGLVKATFPSDGGDASMKQDAYKACSKYLDQEIAVTKPAVIVALGSPVARHLIPGLSGSIVENNGRVFYDKELDASIVVGISAGMIYFNPEYQELLDDVFKKAAGLLTNVK